MIERVVAIPAEHPCLPGHFPGKPVVPAVVILDEVRAFIAMSNPDRQLIVIDHCKFQDFVLPDQPFKIGLTIKGEAKIDFICRAVDDERLLVKGRFRLETLKASA